MGWILPARAVLCLVAATHVKGFATPRARSSVALSRVQAGDDSLPEVAPGEIDWDDEFKKLKRGEVANSAKINEVAWVLSRPTAASGMRG